MRGHAHVIAQRVDHAKEQQSAGIAEAATISLAMIKCESGEQEIFADRLSREVGLIVVGCHFIRPLAALATRQRRIPAVWVRQTNQAAVFIWAVGTDYISIRPRHLTWGFRMVSGVDHVVHDRAAAVAVVNWVSLDGLISEICLQPVNDLVPERLSTHALQTGPVTTAPPAG